MVSADGSIVSLVNDHEAAPEVVAAALRALRNSDGGYPPAAGGISEPEPTALAALALDDEAARTWLLKHQRSDGAWFVGPDALGSDTATPYAALALEGSAASMLAVDYLVTHPAAYVDPKTPENRGWGWTYGTYAWVDPTSRALIALHRLRPDADSIAGGRQVLALRECAGGGWNYGSSEVMDTNLEPYLATTAMAIMALHGVADPMRERGVDTIKRLLQDEDGLLSGAVGVAALRLMGRATTSMQRTLMERFTLGLPPLDLVALAWTTIALGQGVDRFRLRT